MSRLPFGLGLLPPHAFTANSSQPEQSIVWRQWQGGHNFSQEYTTAYDHGSRDGMVGIATLPNGSLIGTFEVHVQPTLQGIA